MPERYRTVAALYREARNSRSDLYRLLCCHKILGMWKHDTYPFDVNQLQRDQRRVTQEMLVVADLRGYDPELEGVSFEELVSRLDEWCAWAIESVSGEALPEPLEDYEKNCRLAAIANILDLAVHRVLADQIARNRSRLRIRRK